MKLPSCHCHTLARNFLRLFLLLICASLLAAAQAENWPCWRGPRLDGTSLERNIPRHWSATSNVVWKTALPGIGHASPIVWEVRLFAVGAMNTEDRILLCLERQTGKLLWQKTVLRSPLEAKHSLNSHAGPFFARGVFPSGVRGKAEYDPPYS